jgi:hypothetical protein
MDTKERKTEFTEISEARSAPVPDPKLAPGTPLSRRKMT